MSFGIIANTTAYIWNTLLRAAVELPNITECGWQFYDDINWLDEPYPTQIEELWDVDINDGDVDINDDKEYGYGNEVKSDNQQDKLWWNVK